MALLLTGGGFGVISASSISASSISASTCPPFTVIPVLILFRVLSAACVLCFVKPSNYPAKIGHLIPGGGTSTREQPVNGDGKPTPDGGTPILAGTSNQCGTSNQKKAIIGMNNKFTEQGNSKRSKSTVVYLLTYEEVMKKTDKVLKKNPDSIRKYASGEKKVSTLCYLAGMVETKGSIPQNRI